MPGMEDIAQLLQSLLSAENKGTEESLNVEESGGGTENEPEQSRGSSENAETGFGGLDALAGLFGSGGESDGNFFSGIDFDMLMKMGMIFAQLQKPDKNVTLLLALKPMMREENQGKIDTALKLMKIMGILPYLRESGLLNNLF